MFSTNTSKFGELSTTTDISKVRLVTIPNKDIKISPAPNFTTDNSHLVGVTSENKGVLIPPSELIPGIAFNSYDGDPKPMVSGEIWNEQEQLREAFTVGDGFKLPHFRYVADDYFWKSIVGDKVFYYLTSMDLVTWPLAWTPGTSNPALHLEWLRAPEQTQIFKFTDATPNSNWSAPSAYGNIILKNRTDAMVQVDPMEVRVNECSTSTNLKEVRVVVKSKDASPLYINFPGADVSITIPQTTAYNTSDNGIMRNIKITSNTSTDMDAKCEWNSLTINTSATKLIDCFNVEDTGKVCSGTVWVNAPSVTTITNCFVGDYIPGNGIPDVRIALTNQTSSFSFYENFPLKKETILYLLENFNTSKATAATGYFTYTATPATAPTNSTISVNGINIPMLKSDSTVMTAAEIAAAVNADTNLSKIITATSTETRVTFTAKKVGTTGNNITLSTTNSTDFPVSGTTLTNGKNATGVANNNFIVSLGIDAALCATYNGAFMVLDEDIQAIIESLDGIIDLSWHPISVGGGGVHIW